MKLLEVTADTFDKEVEKSNIPVVIDFWAEWCPPCKALAPLLTGLADKYIGKIKVVKIDIEAEPELAVQFNVTALPTLCVVIKGKVTDQEIGFGGKAKLAAMFDRIA